MYEQRIEGISQRKIQGVKPKYFFKQSSSSSFLLTQGNNTGPKCQFSTQQASSMS